MAFSRRPRRFSVSASLLVAAVIVILATPLVQAQTPRVILRVADTTAWPGQQNAVIAVYMDNFFPDIVTGFDITLRLGSPDIMEFKVDTVQEVFNRYFQCQEWDGDSCLNWIEVDSTQAYDSSSSEIIDVVKGNVDTSGTLCSGWEYMRVQSESGDGLDMRITGTADWFGAPFTPGISPQQGGVLFKVLGDVYDIADTIEDRTVVIGIEHGFFDDLIVSGEDGSAIGMYTREVIDSNCYLCTQWAGDSCLNWERKSMPPWDWCDVDTIDQAYLDTNEVVPIGGALTVLNPSGCCNGIRGNANNDPEDKVNISDVTFLTTYLFGIPSGPPPECLEEGNANGDPEEKTNISDVTYLINYLFGIPNGPPPPACP
jgi:hypothetical protein